MNKFLIEEYPLIVLPSLAIEIGLNEAIFLQHIHYWLGKSKHEHDGRKWTYNSIPEWQEQFPFWSESTIKRVISNLEKQKLLLSTSKYNKLAIDRTKWYSIDYDALESMTRPSGQFDPTIGSERTDASGQIEPTITLSLPERSSETSSKTIVEQDSTLAHDIIDYLNMKASKKYKATSKTARRHINARIKDGFTLDDFKQVIDNKIRDWTHDPKMSKFIRPETLFGTKFESYLNESPSSGKTNSTGVPNRWQDFKPTFE
ncbi:conserved phage C-terminal domain-containing protein [uncultured Exiguobacterium sp.]|uniref:conserved phage C-terminal domain-containing protein n=1 Tax=uncultured Exiguobacterium sp. TaxID=202669 RepID=UPI0025FFF2B8|nr:conserved phage C-terminal domain-containing protein [uncultured Exiguobacterium sp.]